MAKILIIDDDLVSRKYLKTLCENLGHDAVDAGGGEEGVAAARLQKPNLVIIDFLMPGMGGLEVLEAIKSAQSDCRTILVSGKMKTESQAFLEIVHNIGADLFLEKPLDATRLAMHLETLLG